MNESLANKQKRVSSMTLSLEIKEQKELSIKKKKSVRIEAAP